MARGTMPSIAQETLPTQQSSSCKKRRREDSDNRLQQLPFSHSSSNASRRIYPDNTTFNGNHDSSLFQHHVSPLAMRKVIPLPSSKRQRTSVDTEAEGDAMQRSPFNPPSRRSPVTKLQPISPIHTTNSAPSSVPAPGPVMSRCYICFRKPTKKTDLDSFADCQGCGQRTCFVCMRQCLGWGPSSPQPKEILSQFPPSMQMETSFTMLDADDAAENVNFDFRKPQQDGQRGEGPKAGWAGSGHRRMVCSRCCVEKGADGDVVCLGCLPFLEG